MIAIKFAIAEVSYLKSIGFDTLNWRKSADGTKAMAHAEFILSLASPDKVTVYDVPSNEFKALLSSPEWTKEEYTGVGEIFE